MDNKKLKQMIEKERKKHERSKHLDALCFDNKQLRDQIDIAMMTR